MLLNKTKIDSGFTLVEMLVGAAVFAVIAVSVFQTYSTFINLVAMGRYKILATDIINEQFELVRNLKYADVGIKNSIPNGVLTATTTVVKANFIFDVTRTIRNIDDPFDGQIGQSPNDLSPSDYKLVEVTVECSACKNFQPLSVTGRVAPKNLETASNNGALFVRVFDASGNPVPDADVHIVNVATTSTIVIDDVTNNSGLLQVVDAPPGAKAYRIIVSKPGFSTDRTYATSSSNPNPVNPDATVLNQQVTQTSFVIDKLSSLNFNTITSSCTVVPNVSFDLKGGKLLGTSPNVLKVDSNYTTDSVGNKNISSIEWDTYSFSITSPGVYLAGSNPSSPFSILPNSTQNVSLILTSGNPNYFLVSVLDGATNLPVSGASLTLAGQNLLSGRGYLEQTDWSGGSGQADFTNPAQYFSSDGNLEIGSPAGDLKLKQSLGDYAPYGELTSSVFDMGTSSNFGNIFWSPSSQSPQAGPDSLRFQIASAVDNDASTVWNFQGPDGTGASYYTVSNTNVSSTHNGARYFRYKVFFSTIDPAFTPLLANVAVTFTSECIPPGQAIFSGLSNGNYNLIVAKAGFATQDIPISISSSWGKQDVILLSE